jgi:hypothetical protein
MATPFFQALFKRVIRKGLKIAYSQTKNEKFTSFVRACISLPYVPLDRIDEGFELLR